MLTRPAAVQRRPRPATPRAREWWAQVALLGVAAVILAVGLPPALALLLCIAPALEAGRLVLRRPQSGVLLLLALVPLDGLADLPAVPTPVKGWKEGLVLLIAFGAFRHGEARRLPPVRTQRWGVPLLGLLALSGLAVLLQPSIVGIFGLKVSFFYAILTVVLLRCPFDATDRDRLVSVLMGAGVATSLFGLLQQLIGAERLVGFGFSYNEQVRFSGGLLRSFSTFNQPFPFAYFLVLVLLVGLPVALGEPGRLRNKLFLVATPLLVVALASTVVRTAAISLALGLVWLFARGYRGIGRVVPALIAAGALAVLLVSSPLVEGARGSDSANDRVSTWRANAGDVLRSPLGHGVGTVGSAAERASIAEIGLEETRYVGTLVPPPVIPDNQYFSWAYEVGFLGLWLFLHLLVAATRTAVDAYRAAVGRDRDLMAGLAASSLAVIVSCVSANYLQAFPMDVYFWTFLGLVSSFVVERRWAAGAPPATPRPGPELRPTGLIVG